MYDIGDVAARLGVSSKTIRRMIERGELTIHRVGRLIRISKSDFHEYVTRQRRVLK
jgi:excisionase family DNA binding protein